MEEKRLERVKKILKNNDLNFDEFCENDNSIKTYLQEYKKNGNRLLLQKIVKYYKLITELSKRNLKLREDSSLCKNFIENTDLTDEFLIKNEVENIVNIMDEMNWYYNYSSYEDEYKHLNSLCVQFESDSDYDTDDYCDYKYQYHNRRKFVSRDDMLENSKQAKNKAIKNWIENGFMEPLPPKSLYQKIEEMILKIIMFVL